MSLPPLPNKDIGETDCQAGYSDESVQAYGQQCREAALEEVIALFKEHYTLTTREVISQVRSLK